MDLTPDKSGQAMTIRQPSSRCIGIGIGGALYVIMKILS
jgi:hypothetical protein